MGNVLLEVKSIRTAMDGVEILRDVSFELEAGECLAVIGANGAGKSILAKIIAGNLTPDRGRMTLEGEELFRGNPKENGRAGIAALYQSVNLIEELSAAENIMLGCLPKKRFGRVDWDKTFEEAGRILQELGSGANPRQRVRELEYTQKRIVELAKVVFRGFRILILDEPYLGASEKEQQVLKSAFQKLQRKGVGIIIISHFFHVVRFFCDSAIFIQKGVSSGKIRMESLTNDTLMFYFTGSRRENVYPKLDLELGDTLLEVRRLSFGSFCDISFSLRQHEILGICGNADSGKYQLMRVISGMEKAEQGEIRMKNRRLEVNSVKDAFHEGIVYIPEIPDGLDDLFLHMSIAENVSVADLPREPGYLPYASGNARDQAEQMCRNLCVSGYRGLETPVEKLSGGNQQKIRLGRRLFTESRVLLLEEPTRGIDIVSKVDFYNHICDFVVGRAGVILLSSDMNELVGLCDRILVMEGGRFRAEINRQEIEKLGSYV